MAVKNLKRDKVFKAFSLISGRQEKLTIIFVSFEFLTQR